MTQCYKDTEQIFDIRIASNPQEKLRNRSEGEKKGGRGGENSRRTVAGSLKDCIKSLYRASVLLTFPCILIDDYVACYLSFSCCRYNLVNHNVDRAITRRDGENRQEFKEHIMVDIKL